MERRWIGISACLLFAAVAFGAFGAHGLKDFLDPEASAWFQTAVSYHFIHALGMLIIASLGHTVSDVERRRLCLMLFGGICLFSGSLYLLAVSGQKSLGAVTPFGGLLFLSGWGYFAFLMFSSRTRG